MAKIIHQPKGFKKITASASVLPQEGVLYLPENTTLDVTDSYDNPENGVLFLAGYHPIKFSKIRTIEVGKNVYLCHSSNEIGVGDNRD
jgi:hypothetical protein